jgi:hypothetical protein
MAYTADQIASLIGNLATLPRVELEKLLADPKTSALEVFVLSIISKGIKEGDQARLEFLLQRTVGKVKEKIEVTAKPTMTINRPSGETLVLSQGEVIEGEIEEKASE